MDGSTVSFRSKLGGDGGKLSPQGKSNGWGKNRSHQNAQESCELLSHGTNR